MLKLYDQLIKVLILYVALTISTTVAKSPRSTTLRVRTPLGSVTGYQGKTSNRFVLPYALPPTGSRRFADPVAMPSFRGYDSTVLPPPCAQSSLTGGSTAEDCLYLTVYTPPGAVTPSTNLPVFVWVHGGSFSAGSTTASGLDGSALANSQNMVVVTVQYRLGVLGFLKSDSLGVAGNFGLKDLIMALTYLQSQIASFGGNPASVTLAGQSSGAEMIKSLLVTPSATSLFARTILHSAPLNYGDQSVAGGNAVGDAVAKSLACTTIDCLRSASVANILQVQSVAQSFLGADDAGASPYEPLRVVADGTLVSRQFGAVTLTGGKLEGSGKPMIFTTVKNEGCESTLGVPGLDLPVPNNNDTLAKHVSSLSGSAEEILGSGLYALEAADQDGVRNSVSTLITDQIWTCNNQQSAVNLTAANPSAPVYLAQFSVGVSYYNNTIPFCLNKVGHEDDIYTVFNTAPSRLSRAQSTVTHEVQARWGAFSHTGSPNSASGPFTLTTWNPVSGATQLNLLVFGGGTGGAGTIAQEQRKEECAVGSGFWGRTVPFDGQVLYGAQGGTTRRAVVAGAAGAPKHRSRRCTSSLHFAPSAYYNPIP